MTTDRKFILIIFSSTSKLVCRKEEREETPWEKSTVEIGMLSGREEQKSKTSDKLSISHGSTTIFILGFVAYMSCLSFSRIGREEILEVSTMSEGDCRSTSSRSALPRPPVAPVMSKFLLVILLEEEREEEERAGENADVTPSTKAEARIAYQDSWIIDWCERSTMICSRGWVSILEVWFLV